MRIPFDLIAAMLAVYAFRETWASNPLVHWTRDPDQLRAQAEALGAQGSSTSEAFAVLGLFLLLVWLYAELSTRFAERYTAYGRDPYGVRSPDGRLPRWHPYVFYSRLNLAGQILSVLGYCAFIWIYRWPLKTCAWPEWVGLAWLDVPAHARDFLGQSQLAGTLTDVGPFALAMIISWLPRRRFLSSGQRSGSIAAYLSFEARLTFLPLAMWICFSFFGDAFELAKLGLPAPWTQAIETLPEWASLIFSLLALFAFAVLVMPWLMVRVWNCQPLPDGPLRQRLLKVMAKSGVDASAILTWGGSGTGFINAAVVGPWARMRYILISPALVKHLDADECEAVLAHELGHARYGHLTLLLFAVLLFSAVGSLAAYLIPGHDPILEAAAFIVSAGLFLRLFLGRIMRACEHEADLASAEIMGSPLPLVSALEKVARLAGGIRDIFSWHHGTIAGRVEHVMEVGLDSARGAAYHRGLKYVRRGVILLTILLLALQIGAAMLYQTKAETGDAPEAEPAASAKE